MTHTVAISVKRSSTVWMSYSIMKLHHQKKLGFPLWHVCNCPVVTALAAGRSMHGVPCLPYIILHR